MAFVARKQGADAGPLALTKSSTGGFVGWAAASASSGVCSDPGREDKGCLEVKRGLDPLEMVVVVVPIDEVVARLPKEALSPRTASANAFIQLTPTEDLASGQGPIGFKIAAIQQVCPHLFHPAYRVHAEDTIRVPEHLVFLGLPRRHAPSPTTPRYSQTPATSSIPEVSMNLSQPSRNGPGSLPGVRPLTGPSAGSGGESAFKADEAPTVRVYPSANQLPVLSNEDRPASPPTRPAAHSAGPSPSANWSAGGSYEHVELNLREVLEGVPIAKLGFDARKIPANVTTKLPLSRVEPQVTSGRVTVSLGEVISGCLDKYRPAFTKADVAELVRLPIQKIHQQLPPKPAMHPPQESPFQPVNEQAPATENPFQAVPPAQGLPFDAQSGPSAVPQGVPFHNPFGQSQKSAFAQVDSPFEKASPDMGDSASGGSPFAHAPGAQSPFAKEGGEHGWETPFTVAGQEPAPSPFDQAPSPAQAQRPVDVSPFAPAGEKKQASPFSVPGRTSEPGHENGAQQAAASPFAPAGEPVHSPFSVQDATSGPGGHSGQAAGASPFAPAGGTASPFAATGSPFQTAEKPGGSQREPAANGAPSFPMAPAQFQATPAVDEPVKSQGAPASPFTAATPADSQEAPSPFSAAPPTESREMPPSPFTAAPPVESREMPPSPFAAAPPVESREMPPSPFTAAPPSESREMSSSPFAPPQPAGYQGAPASPFAAAPPAGHSQELPASPFAAAPPAGSQAPTSPDSRLGDGPTPPPFQASTPAAAAPPVSSAPPASPFAPAAFGQPQARETAAPPSLHETMPSPFEPAQPVTGGPQDNAPIPSRETVSVGQPGLGSQTAPSGGSQAGRMAAGGPQAQRSAFDFGFEADPKQLVLRALFGVATPLSVEDVLERMAAFIGIEACIIIDKQNGKVRASRGNDPGRTSTFESQAQQAYNKVISLAADLNVTDAESFTLRTGVGAMSFFNSPKVCLAVLQENSTFDPGVRERLTLVTRELSEMMD